MAEYFLEPDGQIYGDVAYRLGKIIHQYENCIEAYDEENFITTLCISSLQSLLTIYIGMLKKVCFYIHILIQSMNRSVNFGKVHQLQKTTNVR